MKFYNSLIIFIIFLTVIEIGVALAEDRSSSVSTIPLPSKLSDDAKFIIFYMEKRFEMLQREMDKRFEQVDKRFELLQQEIDKRFEQVDKRFEQVDKRFEQVDKRFEDINARFEQMMTFLWILTGIFTTITMTTIAFAMWDRRTMMKQAKDETIKQIEKEGSLQDFIKALRAFAKKNKEFAEILRSFNLL